MVAAPISVVIAIAGGLRHFPTAAAKLPNLLLGNAIGSVVLVSWAAFDDRCGHGKRGVAHVRSVFRDCAPSLNLSRVALEDHTQIDDGALRGGARGNVCGLGSYRDCFSQFTLWHRALELAEAIGAEVVIKTRPDLLLHSDAQLVWLGRAGDATPVVQLSVGATPRRVVRLNNDSVFTLMADFHRLGQRQRYHAFFRGGVVSSMDDTLLFGVARVMRLTVGSLAAAVAAGVYRASDEEYVSRWRKHASLPLAERPRPGGASVPWQEAYPELLLHHHILTQGLKVRGVGWRSEWGEVEPSTLKTQYLKRPRPCTCIKQT